jgi:hypothetical protein
MHPEICLNGYESRISFHRIGNRRRPAETEAMVTDEDAVWDRHVTRRRQTGKSLIEKVYV